jgi:uncharacterized protein
MKRFALVLLLAAAFCWPAFAQSTDDTPASKEDVERYFAVAKSHDMMKKMMATMSETMRQVFHEQYLEHKDDLPADYESKIDADLNEMFVNMPMDDILQAMAPAYQKHLTKGDVDNLIAFYSTPTGQKLLSEMPAILADSMRDALPIITKYAEGVRTKLQKETDDMIAQGKKPSAGKAPSASN